MKKAIKGRLLFLSEKIINLRLFGKRIFANKYTYKIPIYSGLIKYIEALARKNAEKQKTYQQWLENHLPNQGELKIQFAQSKKIGIKLNISIITPVYNPKIQHLKSCLESVLMQSYPFFEHCLVDDCSTDPKVLETIKKFAAKDNRIKFKRLNSNKNISLASNEAVKLSSGDYIGFLDHDDCLAPNALFEVVKRINEDRDCDIIYSDEDKISENGQTHQLPFFKPDWSPELLLGVNYINHFLVVKKSLFLKIGGFRKGFEGSQDYDLILRLVEKTNSIEHIPKILYHWRLAKGSTAKTVNEKSYADSAGQKALSEAITRRGIQAKVIAIPERPTNYRVQYTIPHPTPKVSVIIPFKDQIFLTRKCVGSILEKTSYPNYEIVLISNNSKRAGSYRLIRKLKKDSRCRIYEWNQPFNYSKINNFGASKASGSYLIFLNNDTEIIDSNWAEELIGIASQKGIGAVGPALFYSAPLVDIQHAGIVLGMGGMAGHVFRHRQFNEWTDFGLPCWPRNYLAVTGACLAIKKEAFNKIGGFDERFIVAGSDVALCISLYRKGYRNVYWPFASLLHHESATIGSYDTGVKNDYDYSLEYYKEFLEKGDPYFNPNLDLQNERVAIGN